MKIRCKVIQSHYTGHVYGTCRAKMKLLFVNNCLLPHLNTPKNLLTEKKELFFYKEILNLFLPIFNKLNYKFEKKSPFFLP